MGGKAKPETVTRSIRLRLHAPVEGSWEEVGPGLHAIKTVMHRLLQAATLEEIIASHERRKPDRVGAVKAELASAQKYTKNDRIREMRLASSITDAVQMRARQAAQNYLNKRFREPMRIPSASYPSPIFVRDGRWQIEINGRLVLAAKLHGGRSEWHRFVCSPLRGPHWEIVRALAVGSTIHKPGDLKIVYSKRKDRRTGKKRGWEAIITVTSPAPARSRDDGILVVHRGRHNFLYAATEATARPLVSGAKLQATKSRIRARKGSLQKSLQERGRGARGHGKKRAYESYRALEDKESRFVRTYCQQAAAAAVKAAQQHGCGVLVREEYGGIVPDEAEARYVDSFPYYQLGECIDWAAKKAGLEVVKVPAEYISTTCPRCSNHDARQHNGRGTFHCRRCGFERPADFVAALHLLRRAGADMSTWERRFRALDALAEGARA